MAADPLAEGSLVPLLSYNANIASVTFNVTDIKMLIKYFLTGKAKLSILGAQSHLVYREGQISLSKLLSTSLDAQLYAEV